MPAFRTDRRSNLMRLTLPRLLVLAVPLALLAGCGTTRSCGSDSDYLQAVERAPIKLPPEVTPTERIQPLAIPPVDPNPAKLDPQPRCLDEPPKFFARKGAVADPAEEAVRLWAWAWASRKADAVIQMYSPGFQSAGEGGVAAFLEQRRQQVETGRPPEPKLEDVAVTASGADRRVVTFVQRFGEGGVRKELTLAREGEIWRIVAERTLEVL
jgi:hypothetical protein